MKDKILFLILFCINAFGEKAPEKIKEVIKELEK